jgi:hypothetical protein
VSEPVDCEPLTPLLPDQPPDAVQAVALAVDQESVELPPLFTLVGLAARVTVGGVVDVCTDTDFEAVVLPPCPVQVSV